MAHRNYHYDESYATSSSQQFPQSGKQSYPPPQQQQPSGGPYYGLKANAPAATSYRDPEASTQRFAQQRPSGGAPIANWFDSLNGAYNGRGKSQRVILDNSSRADIEQQYGAGQSQENSNPLYDLSGLGHLAYASSLDYNSGVNDSQQHNAGSYGTSAVTERTNNEPSISQSQYPDPTTQIYGEYKSHSATSANNPSAQTNRRRGNPNQTAFTSPSLSTTVYLQTPANTSISRSSAGNRNLSQSTQKPPDSSWDTRKITPYPAALAQLPVSQAVSSNRASTHTPPISANSVSARKSAQTATTKLTSYSQNPRLPPMGTSQSTTALPGNQSSPSVSQHFTPTEQQTKPAGHSRTSLSQHTEPPQQSRPTSLSRPDHETQHAPSNHSNTEYQNSNSNSSMTEGSFPNLQSNTVNPNHVYNSYHGYQKQVEAAEAAETEHARLLARQAAEEAFQASRMAEDERRERGAKDAEELRISSLKALETQEKTATEAIEMHHVPDSNPAPAPIVSSIEVPINYEVAPDPDAAAIEEDMKSMLKKMRAYQSRNPKAFTQVWNFIKGNALNAGGSPVPPAPDTSRCPILTMPTLPPSSSTRSTQVSTTATATAIPPSPTEEIAAALSISPKRKRGWPKSATTQASARVTEDSNSLQKVHEIKNPDNQQLSVEERHSLDTIIAQTRADLLKPSGLTNPLQQHITRNSGSPVGNVQVQKSFSCKVCGKGYKKTGELIYVRPPFNNMRTGTNLFQHMEHTPACVNTPKPSVRETKSSKPVERVERLATPSVATKPILPPTADHIIQNPSLPLSNNVSHEQVPTVPAPPHQRTGVEGKHTQQSNGSRPPTPIEGNKQAPHIHITPKETIIWPVDYWQTISTIAFTVLNSLPENYGKIISAKDIHDMLNFNPSYVELCDMIARLGFKFDRGRFAQTLLSRINWDSTKTADHPVVNTPDWQIVNAVPDSTHQIGAYMKSSPSEKTKAPVAGQTPSSMNKTSNINPAPSDVKNTLNSSRKQHVGQPTLPPTKCKSPYIVPVAPMGQSIIRPHIIQLSNLNNSLASASRRPASASSSPCNETGRLKPVAPSQTPRWVADMDDQRVPRLESADAKKGSISHIGNKGLAGNIHRPNKLTTQSLLTKEMAARKRTFAEIVGLTMEQSDDNSELRSTKIRRGDNTNRTANPASPITDNVIGESLVQGIPATAADSSHLQQLQQGEAAVAFAKAPSTTPNFIGPAEFSKQLLSNSFEPFKDIVKPISKSRALRKSRYDPKTIARDILISTSTHPIQRGLNWHLEPLKLVFTSVNNNSDLATFRWDIVDPSEPSQGSCDMPSTLSDENGSATSLGKPNNDNNHSNPPKSRAQFKPTRGGFTASRGRGRPSMSAVPVHPSSLRKEVIDLDSDTEAVDLDQSNPLSLLRKPGRLSKVARGEINAGSKPTAHDRPVARRGRLPRPNSRSTPGTDVPQLPKRHRRPARGAISQVVASPIKFHPYICEWLDCKAELQNLETLRKHLVVVHGKKLPSGTIVCQWAKCGSIENVWNPLTLKAQKEYNHPDFDDLDSFKDHVEKAHLNAIAWHMGDGPKGSLLG